MTSVPFGVLTANNLLPSADSASGRTWPLSNVMKEGGVARAWEVISKDAIDSTVAVTPAWSRLRLPECRVDEAFMRVLSDGCVVDLVVFFGALLPAAARIVTC
jgi:hypothetical protein